MWQDRQVWLHGDATPANFLFGHSMDVAAIDLERMKRGDRMFDVGRVAGELQHAFMRDSGDRYRKPDRRLFQLALDGMGVPAGNTLYVGNDMYRDIYGAREAGLKTVMFSSDQGAKAYRDCLPDYTIADFRDLLRILGLPGPDRGTVAQGMPPA
jgi:ribonucleotide monophosphatase NagD (HAD superfamily)